MTPEEQSSGGGISAGTVLGGAGALAATAGLGYMAHRYLHSVGRPTRVLNAAKQQHASQVLRDLRPGDILTHTYNDAASVNHLSTLDARGKLVAAAKQIPAELLGGTGGHSGIYLGKGKVMHYYPPEMGGYIVRDVGKDLVSGSYVTRPNLSQKERFAAARRARELHASGAKPPEYAMNNAVAAGFNKILPVDRFCSTKADGRQICSEFVSNMYEGKLLPKGLPSHLVTPTDLAGGEGALVRKIR